MRAKDRTHCVNGHEFTPENTGRDRNRRYCRICKRARFNHWLEGEGKKESRARYWLKWRYGLTEEAVELILKAQGNCCALCKRPFSTEPGMEPVVDHCHVTGKNRGIVHKKCNMALGLLGDDAVTCRLAAEYLEKHQ
jgi:hypothetical protein